MTENGSAKLAASQPPVPVWWWIILLGVFAAPLSLVGVGLQDRISGPHQVHWRYGDRSPVLIDKPALYPWRGCRPNDIGMNSLVHEGVLWTACDAPDPKGEMRVGNTSLARIDPARGEAVVWLFPKAALHKATRGVAEGPDGQLAIVYWANKLHGNLTVGIISEAGWTLRPIALPSGEQARLSAVRFDGATLEVVYEPGSFNFDEPLPPEESRPILARINGGKISTRRFPIPRCSEAHCGSLRFCRLVRGSQRWEAWFEHYPKTPGIVAIDLDGKQRSMPTLPPTTSVADRCDPHLWNDVEATVLGLTEYSTYTALRDNSARRVDAEGELHRLEPPPVAWSPAYAYSWLDLQDGKLRRWPGWETQVDGVRFWVRPMSDGYLLLGNNEDHIDHNLRATWLANDGKTVRISRVIARAPGYLVGGVPIARPSGGLWLVSQDGFYVTLGADLSRQDPLALLAHLRARGSLLPEGDERFHELALAWLVVGLPLLVLLGLIWARVRRSSRRTALIAAAVIYLPTALYALADLLPLLR